MDHSKHVDKYGLMLHTKSQMLRMFEEAGFAADEISYARGFMMPKLMTARNVK